ncbi:MAG: peptidylprolyl isomerase [Candidatus Aminicenantes bacterium]|nr:peptidylprolyl isomerase [Candidatus Aminicenantes bacterium]
MKKILTLSLVISLIILSCAPKKEEVVVEKGTPEYQMAKDLSSIIKALDPDVNKVLIKAKDFNITTSEVIKFIIGNLGNRADQIKQMDADSLRQYIERNVQLLTDRKLILAEAKKANVTVPREDIDKVINEQAEKAGDIDKFTEILTANGITIDKVRENIEVEIIVQRFMDSVVANNITVTDAEVESIYLADKTASVRHILLLTQGKTDAEKVEIRTKMEGILASAKGGEDFAALAKEFTEDPGSKENGGLYENFGRGKMVKPFEDAAFSIPVGEISDIVETRYGLHILKIVDRQKETSPLEEVKEEIVEQIKQSKIGQNFSVYMAGLRLKAEIVVNPL